MFSPAPLILYLLLVLSLSSSTAVAAAAAAVAAAAPATTSSLLFCKCTCFANSTIIPLLATGNCNDCNRQFCLGYNLPICKSAKEADVATTCFRAVPPPFSIFQCWLCG